MFRELKGEIAKAGMSQKELASKAEMSYSTFLDKINGRTSFTFDECVRIKKELHSELPLERLFFCSK